MLITRDYLIRKIEAQKKTITCLYLIFLDVLYIVTATMDGIIKLHTKEGTLAAQININHPLPLKWEI